MSAHRRCNGRALALPFTIASVDLRDTADEAAFRAELRTWLEENLPPTLRGHRGGAARFDEPELRAWSRALYDAGYAGLTWPKEYGGGGAPYPLQAIFLEEVARAEAPPHIGVIGLGMAGPTIMAHGTEDQKARHLAAILSAEEIWCQGFSEPGAGSDLAGVRTSGVIRDGHFVVDGQKVWSSFAHIADWCLLLTRNDPDSSRHDGLTYLIVDMHSPGVEVRPLRQITGESEFNEIFFNGVEVPIENVLGDVGGGWQVAMTTLLHERGTLGFALQAALEVQVRKLVALAQDRGADQLQRDRIAGEWIELQALRFTNARSLSQLVKTGIPGPEGSIAKLVWSEANQRVTKLALELLGPEAPLGEENASYGGYWQYQQLRSRGNTIEAGTSEILRNIVAERVLGLPRSR
jgi:alkylation response protein AidB-like acyl-CoA dehydrogenase